MSRADEYTKRALELIRVANGKSRDVIMRLNRMARDIRNELLLLPNSSLQARRLKALLARIDRIIADAYDEIAQQQTEFASDLIDIDARWAARQDSAKPLSTAELAAVAAGFTLSGLPVATHWQQQSMLVRNQVAAEIRLAAAARQTPAEAVARVVGSGPNIKGGVLDRPRLAARGIVDATAQSAASAARIEAMRASGKGINAVKWFAILDTKVCPSCAERMDKLWDLDGKPIGHSIAFMPPTLHPWCRCILLPMRYPDGPPEDGGNTTRFEDWLKRRSQEQQDEILGVGRAELWRQGKITTQDLIGQNGLVKTLGELRRELDKR